MPTSRPMKTSGKLDEILSYYTDIDDLKDEMQEWADNMPESLQSSDKYDQVSQAADTLDTAHSELEETCEGIRKLLENVPVVEDEQGMLELNVSYYEQKMYKGYSMPRWIRLCNPVAAMKAVLDLLDTYKDGILPYLNEEDKGALTDYAQRASSALDDLQGVEFPTMYG